MDLHMPNVITAMGQAIFWPVKKLKAHYRRNAIIIAHMTPEELREYKRMRDELRAACENRRAFMAFGHVPGRWF